MNKRPNLYVDGPELTIGFTDGGETFLTIIDELVSRPESEVLLEQWAGVVGKALERQPTPEVQRLLRVLLSKVWPQIVMSGAINYFGLDYGPHRGLQGEEPDPASQESMNAVRQLMEGYEAIWRLAGHDGPPSVANADLALGLRLVDSPASPLPE